METIRIHFSYALTTWKDIESFKDVFGDIKKRDNTPAAADPEVKVVEKVVKVEVVREREFTLDDALKFPQVIHWKTLAEAHPQLLEDVEKLGNC